MTIQTLRQTPCQKLDKLKKKQKKKLKNQKILRYTLNYKNKSFLIYLSTPIM